MNLNDPSGIVIDNKEYTLQGIPPHVYLNGSPSQFFDAKVKLHIVDSVSVCCGKWFKEIVDNGEVKYICDGCGKRCDAKPWIDEPPEGGFNVHYKHVKFPRKGVIDPNALTAVCSVKKIILNSSKWLAHLWWNMPFMIFPFVRRKVLWESAERYVEASDFILNRFYLHPKSYCTVVRELFGVCYRIFSKLPLTDHQHFLVGRMCTSAGMMLESDDSYRYVFQDVAGELNKDNFDKNPAKEIQRLYAILLSRDVGMDEKEVVGANMSHRLNSLVYGLKLAFFLSPKAKRLAKEFVKELDLEKIRLDKGDWYHCCIRSNYKFGGVPYEERLKERIKIDQEWISTNTSTI